MECDKRAYSQDWWRSEGGTEPWRKDWYHLFARWLHIHAAPWSLEFTIMSTGSQKRPHYSRELTKLSTTIAAEYKIVKRKYLWFITVIHNSRWGSWYIPLTATHIKHIIVISRTFSDRNLRTGHVLDDTPASRKAGARNPETFKETNSTEGSDTLRPRRNWTCWLSVSMKSKQYRPDKYVNGTFLEGRAPHADSHNVEVRQ